MNLLDPSLPKASRKSQPELFGQDEPAERFIPPLLGECVLGIDPSLTGFAICYSVPGKGLIEGRWSTEPAVTVHERMERYEKLIRGTLQIVLAHKPGLILIEGYAFEPPGKGKQRGGTHRNELGGVLRWELCKRVQCPIVEVAISSLKKFTTGDGHAKKPAVISVMARAQSRTIKTDDQADAAALCELGLALTGQKPPLRWESPLGAAPSDGRRERVYLAALAKSYGLQVAA